jgi:hypothetical protein
LSIVVEGIGVNGNKWSLIDDLGGGNGEVRVENGERVHWLAWHGRHGAAPWTTIGDQGTQARLVSGRQPSIDMHEGPSPAAFRLHG